MLTGDSSHGPTSDDLFCSCEKNEFIVILRIDQSTNDWDDPELQADIQAATGIDLHRKGRGSKKGKDAQEKFQTGLTDIRDEQNNSPRKRLEAKVLSRYLIRVSFLLFV